MAPARLSTVHRTLTCRAPGEGGEDIVPSPRVIYEPKPGSPLEVDREFYARLARETGSRTLVERFVVPRRSGRAWPVRAGQIFRILSLEGPPGADPHVWRLRQSRG